MNDAADPGDPAGDDDGSDSDSRDGGQSEVNPEDRDQSETKTGDRDQREANTGDGGQSETNPADQNEANTRDGDQNEANTGEGGQGENDYGADREDTPENPIRLRGAQRRLRNAYFEHDSGLFAMQCVPGAGKSVLTHDLAAEELLRRYVDGDPTPELRICVISFNRDEAAGIVPGIIDRLRTLVAHDLTPAGAAASMADVRELETRVRQAPFIGTIDSVLRGLLADVSAAVGFAEPPRDGSEADLAGVHAACYEALQTDPDLADAVDIVETAYPAGEYEAGPADLLREALTHCRAHRLSTAEFVDELRATVDAVYPEGETESITDIADAVARCLDREDVPSEEVREDRDEDACEALLEADRQLRTTWQEAITAFGELLEAYREDYVTRIRERGVVSHTDCAYLVAECLEGSGTVAPDAGTLELSEGVRAEIRERVLARYRSRIESVIIDEAQDVSTLQHAALAPVVTEECRVHIAGDV
ncbi:MAG: UvrD-helicase domain-containing protein, partial [Halobacteriales archaeon]